MAKKEAERLHLVCTRLAIEILEDRTPDVDAIAYRHMRIASSSIQSGHNSGFTNLRYW